MRFVCNEVEVADTSRWMLGPEVSQQNTVLLPADKLSPVSGDNVVADGYI